MHSLIIGSEGEIGSALKNILKDQYNILEKDAGHMYTASWCDKKTGSLDANADLIKDYIDYVYIMHVCIPWNGSFSETVSYYKEMFNPNFVVIHSTVPVGTSRSLGAVHSPCMGRHPSLEKSMRTFTKFIGGEDASAVADYFRRAGLEVYITDKQETTELMKLDSTTWFGVMIEKTKETKKLCEKYGVPFEFFTIWTDRVNEGLEKLGDGRYRRPNLVPIMGKVGGHCVLPNAEIMQEEAYFAHMIQNMNLRDNNES